MSEWEVVPDAPQAKAAPSSDWEVVPDAQAAPPPAAVPAEPQSFWRKAYHAVADKVAEVPENVRKFGEAAGAMTTNALDTATAGGYQFLRNLPQTAKNIASGDAKKIIFGDPEAAPDAITQSTETWNAEHPFAANLSSDVGYMAGAPEALAKASGALVEGAARRTAEGATGVARKALTSRPVTSAATGALTGASTQLAEDVGGGAPLDAETLKRAGAAAAFGGTLGAGAGAAEGMLSRLSEGADRVTEAAKKRAVKDLGKDITSAEGSTARVTDQKKIAEVNDRLFDLTVEHPELRKVFAESAEKALPKIKAVKSAIAAPLDKLYDAVDAKTGGLRLSDVTGDLRARADELSKKRLGLEDAKRFRALADQFEEAYAPRVAPPAAGEVPASPADDAADQLFDLRKLREGAKGVSAKALDEQIAALESTQPARPEDVRIPTRQFREEVTSLHTTAESVMGGLEGTPRHEALAKLYDAGKSIIDKHLDASGVPASDLAKIRDINNSYFLLSRAESAIESRGWKEANKPGFKIPHSANVAMHVGGIAPLAAYGAMHPSSIPYMVGATAATAAAPRVAKAVNWSVARGSYARAVERLAKLARSEPPAQFVAAAVRAGMPRAEAQKISDEAQRTRMAGNP